MIRAMMTQELQASVLTAPLAQIDRRVLSQAWYSALNFARARESAAPAKKPVATNAAAQGRATPASVPNRRTSHAAPPASVAHPVSAKRGVSLDRGVERRAPRSPLARKIESVFLDPRSRVERSTFTVGSGRARVYVALQGKGEKLRLIAVCAPAYREVVAAALAQARFALASRGCALEAARVEERACF
jgi:hypothetical protein